MGEAQIHMLRQRVQQQQDSIDKLTELAEKSLEMFENIQKQIDVLEKKIKQITPKGITPKDLIDPSKFRMR